ncbi:MAG: hypothetical protein LBL07_11220 [Tannerella sp.]|nr:hypothetical protein [Tannerella sp.]
MSNKIILLFLFITVIAGTVNAQYWSKEDSTWLKSVLEGGEIRINEDTKKAIEDGRLIVPSWMKSSDNQIDNIELLKDFDHAGAIDSARIQSIDPYSMPPAVFALYVLNMNKMDSIYESSTCMLTAEDQKKLREMLPPEVRDKIYVTQGIGGIGGMDFNHLLSMVFSPSYRRLAHNAKHATAYKNYYDAGAIKPIGLTEREKKQLRQTVRNIKTSAGREPGMKRNGIDD